jgi:hypothetical protein
LRAANPLNGALICAPACSFVPAHSFFHKSKGQIKMPIAHEIADQLFSAVNEIALHIYSDSDHEVVERIRLLRTALKTGLNQVFPGVRPETDRLAQVVLESTLQKRADLMLSAGYHPHPRTLH